VNKKRFLQRVNSVDGVCRGERRVVLSNEGAAEDGQILTNQGHPTCCPCPDAR
jgi:hypothetical protein